MSSLEEIVCHQLNNLFFLSDAEKDYLPTLIKNAEKTLIKSQEKFKNKYFDGRVNPYNSSIYCVFLYWLSRECYLKIGRTDLADKVYYLNKVLNSVDLFYEVELPQSWMCEHPVGSVMGRAQYGEGFNFSQGCTVGGNWSKGKICYPVIGENVIMLSDSKIVGDSHIGNNVLMSANSYVINRDIPDNCVVFGQGKELVIKEKKYNYGPQ